MIENILKELRNNADPIRAEHAYRFFKTGHGEYGEGDKFLGVPVPSQRAISKKYRELQIEQVVELMQSEWHEERLTAVFILTLQFESADDKGRKKIYDAYLENTNRVNNWDLVDSSAHKIVGPYLAKKPEKMKTLINLAKSDLLWDRRIAIISTLYNIARLQSAEEALELAKILLHDEEDLIHKAVGWCLREVGKNIDEQILKSFLDEYASEMPRVMLRYSLEKLDERTRKHYLSLKTA